MNSKGFTLIEILSVLVILGILIALVVPRFITMDKSAELIGLIKGQQELNNRENLIWSKHKISINDYSDEELDLLIKSEMDLTLGNKYIWNGEVLSFGSISMTLKRIPATNKHPAIWEKI